MPSDVLAGERRPEMYFAQVHMLSCLLAGLCVIAVRTVLKFRAEPIYYAQ